MVLRVSPRRMHLERTGLVLLTSLIDVWQNGVAPAEACRDRARQFYATLSRSRGRSAGRLHDQPLSQSIRGRLTRRSDESRRCSDVMLTN